MRNSVVDGILERHGLVWYVAPYRIETKTGIVIQAGPHFDLRDAVLRQDKEKALKAARMKRYRQVTANDPDVDVFTP